MQHDIGAIRLGSNCYKYRIDTINFVTLLTNRLTLPLTAIKMLNRVAMVWTDCFPNVFTHTFLHNVDNYYFQILFRISHSATKSKLLL